MMPGNLAVVFMMIVALLASERAMARGGGFGGHGGGGRPGGFGGLHGGNFGGFRGGAFRGGHVGIGHFRGFPHHASGGFVFFGGYPYLWPNYWPYYSYPPYYYSPPTVVVPATPPVYIEQGTPLKVQPPASVTWEYCPKPEGYYPHVKECPAGWQDIEPQPTGQQPGYWYYCSDPAGYYPYVRQCSTFWQKIIP